MQGYSEAEVARSGRKTRSTAGPLMNAGRNFADDDMHEHAASEEEEEAEVEEEEDEEEVGNCLSLRTLFVIYKP